MKRLYLQAGRDKSLRRHHPWVFSGSVARVEGEPELGETVAICAANGEVLATAAYSPHSQIRARVWAWGVVAIDAAFIAERIARAVAVRAIAVPSRITQAVRLVHGESDGLPGVIADRYADTVVVQLLSAGAERWRGAIAAALAQVPGVARVFERSDADVRALEGLSSQIGLLMGTASSAPVVVEEHGLQYAIDIDAGHKTGFYLDQRDNRWRLRDLARGQTVLDCFCYTGGFARNARAGGAVAVTAVDSSAAALAVAQAQATHDPITAPAIEWLEADVFKTLRGYRDANRQFGVIVLDPPKFAPTAAHADKAARAYKDINLLAFKLLAPGGVLMTYSCSGGISPDLFQKIVAGAALDAGVDACMEGGLHAAADHPVALQFPEGQYLKGLLCRVRM